MSTRGKRKTGRSSTLLWVAAGVGTLVCLFVLAVLVDSALSYNKVHSGIRVAGVDLGGLTKAEAISALDQAVKAAQDDPITLRAGDKSWTVLPTDVGAAVNVEAVVKTAMGVTRQSNVFGDIGARWKLYFSTNEVPLTGTVDSAKLAAFIAGIASMVDVPPVDAGLVIENGTIKMISSSDGKVVDQDQLTKDLTGSLLALRSTGLTVPIVDKAPAVTADDNAEAQQQAETMISGEVTVTSGDDDWTITPEQIASSMGFKAEMRDGRSTLVPFMDATKLQPLLDAIAPLVQQAATDAHFEHNDTKVWVAAGKTGKELDPEATAEAITKATLKKSGRTAKVALKSKDPAITAAKLKEMGVKTLLASYKTRYYDSADRRTNVKMATKYATNVLLAPGEEYDFDERVGPRTPARGFKLAKGITGPGVLEDVLGGGICQVSTTMFNAVAGGKAGLKIDERWNHSIYISHYPKGRDATVTAGGKNLRFTNDTEHYIWIAGDSDGVTTIISVWGTDQGRTTEWQIGEYYSVVPKGTTSSVDASLKPGRTSLVQAGQNGKSLKSTRIVKENGQVIHKDTWTNVWPMFPDKIAVGPTTTKPTASSTTTTKPPVSSTTTTTTAGGT
jgi:vancomycin resistance protein YoaR